MIVNNTWMASLAFWLVAASVAAGTTSNGQTRGSSGPAAPCGIYALDSRGGPYRDANIRNYPFVEGYVLRPSWSELEPRAGAYDFTMIDQVVMKLQAIGKKLSLEMMRPPEPGYLVERSGALTWFDTWRDLNTVRPAPWDPYTLERFKALARAMAEHPVPDLTKGGTKTRFRDHPVLANINFGIPGAHAAIRSPVQFRLIDMPGYTREKFKSAVLESLHAMTDNFPAKAAYIGFWTVQDGQSPALWEEIQSAIHSEFDGKRNPNVGFFQENLAASKDSSTGAITGTPRTTFAAPLYLSRDKTPILFQALQSWNNPFSNPAQTADTTPADALQFAYDTYRATYFELYVNDLDDRKYWDSLTEWNARLCRSEQGDGSGAVNVLFTIHFDPLLAPSGQVSRAAYEGQRDNLAWLADYFDEIERSRGTAFVPKLTLEIGGDHAEYYAEDAVGLALLQRLYARGHELAIHFHTSYKTGPHQWTESPQ